LGRPGGGSTETVPISPGRETSRSSRSSEVPISLCFTPPGIKHESPASSRHLLPSSKASNGWMRAQLTTAITGMTKPTGWHYHVCEGQFVYTLKGWVELEFEDGSSCRLEAGDSCFIPGGLKHNEIGTSDDLEILEVSLPGEIGTVSVDPPPGRPNGS